MFKCEYQMINQAFEEHRSSVDVSFGCVFFLSEGGNVGETCSFVWNLFILCFWWA